jgi:signal transduction histidine kinase
MRPARRGSFGSMGTPALGDAAGGRPRDRAADTVLFGLALSYTAVWTLLLLDDPTVSRLPLNAGLSLAACTALWLRRRFPVQLTAVLVPLAAFADLAAGALMVALFTVAAYRPARYAAVLGAAYLLTRSVLVLVVADPAEPTGWFIAIAAVSALAAIGWGLYVRHRRALLESLRERATEAETRARLHTEQAQQRTRQQIAREIHDVLGHRLSLLSVHAGALEFRPDAPPQEISQAAAVIRENAHQALQDLREVVGVLRAPVGELPQPTLADVDRLLEEARQAGSEVEAVRHLTEPPPDPLVRAAYRIIQEALTNVRKHAPGAEVRLALSGAPEDGLTVTVDNTPSEHPPKVRGQPPQSPGQGLVGLAERVELLDGSLTHGPRDAGGYRLHAWLPWRS